MSAKREEKRNKERFVKVKNLPDNKKCFPIGQAPWPTVRPRTPAQVAFGRGARNPWPLLRVGAASEHLRGPVKLAHGRGAEPSGSALGVCKGDAFQVSGTESATDRESLAILPWNAHLVSLGPPLCRLT